MTKKLKSFIKLENLLEEQKNQFVIDFFAFNEEANQKIEIFVLEIKNKSNKGSPISPKVKASLKKTSAATSNKASKDYTTSNKLSKDYTPASILNDRLGDNFESSFTNTGKNSKSSLTFEDKAKINTVQNFPAFSDKNSVVNTNHPLGFIKYDNFFNTHPKTGEELHKNLFLLIDSKKQELSSEFVLPRKSFDER